MHVYKGERLLNNLVMRCCSKFEQSWKVSVKVMVCLTKLRRSILLWVSMVVWCLQYHTYEQDSGLDLHGGYVSPHRHFLMKSKRTRNFAVIL